MLGERGLVAMAAAPERGDQRVRRCDKMVRWNFQGGGEPKFEGDTARALPGSKIEFRRSIAWATMAEPLESLRKGCSPIPVY